MSEKFSDPKFTINKVYTRSGDEGMTSLVGGNRVQKDDVRIECYGTLDELNAFVGSTIQSIKVDMKSVPDAQADLVDMLVKVQHHLFNAGSILATMPEDVHPKQPQIEDVDIEDLERDIDMCNDTLPDLKSFILPGGCRANTDMHVCRTVCRRAERSIVALNREENAGVPPAVIKYVNRLSDAFFVWGRWLCVQIDVDEMVWNPNVTKTS
ncbi:hypothetical protein SARC_05645 [Sphaeroforma arctica JP610]|uniref:Corrinoid adenosyltransferase MMAB n=1 Tax=Sphaeroforma arctica JP610 TaxID=667725 RepID=A0A0L0FZQ5_9EUKA|nr:hypothetical protein SARC_05645 [Sphaeroforma arctica JP610]KNC82051.1 hypothetical protein SARC_05645 [Sphaeroforma arctica JP610]|eukprot:XP_014155953.1 hypothetical protein SARC_05645 [Sphaeroforma arctica JP610]